MISNKDLSALTHSEVALYGINNANGKKYSSGLFYDKFSVFNFQIILHWYSLYSLRTSDIFPFSVKSRILLSKLLVNTGVTILQRGYFSVTLKHVSGPDRPVEFSCFYLVFQSTVFKTTAPFSLRFY
jgi:hypothetical protein